VTSTIDFNDFQLTHLAVIIIFRPNALAYFAAAKKESFMAFTHEPKLKTYSPSGENTLQGKRSSLFCSGVGDEENKSLITLTLGLSIVISLMI